MARYLAYVEVELLSGMINMFSYIYQYICRVFHDSSVGRESACNAGDLASIPGLGRSPGEGKGYALQLFWPEEFHGQYSPWGCKESDMTEQLSLSLSY